MRDTRKSTRTTLVFAHDSAAECARVYLMTGAALELARRQFLGRMTTGLTGVALVRLLRAGLLWAAGGGVWPHFAPKAKRVLQIFCPGGAAHVDLWDHQPLLEKFHGTPLPGGDAEVSF